MILDDIVANKRIELSRTKEEVSFRDLEKKVSTMQAPLDFESALRGNGVQLIAEVKKASPSKGLLCPDFDPLFLAGTYAENGAAAISVLTEAKFFQGDISFLSAIKAHLNENGRRSVPLLRKDFLFDPYQIIEARANGADALLLIVAILDDLQLRELLSLSHQLGMKCLVEVHDEEEMERAVGAGANVIGINNRDLRTFKTELAVTERLASIAPGGKVIVSESGIRSREDVMKLGAWGVSAMLVGEALVVSPDIGLSIRELMGR